MRTGRAEPAVEAIGAFCLAFAGAGAVAVDQLDESRRR